MGYRDWVRGTIQGISICLRQHGTPYSWEKGITQHTKGDLDEENDNEARKINTFPFTTTLITYSQVETFL
jgi:hypothetical protein